MAQFVLGMIVCLIDCVFGDELKKLGKNKEGIYWFDVIMVDSSHN